MENAPILVTRHGLELPAHALRWEFSRASGPGGQHRNKTSSRATLVVDLTALTGPEQTRRSVLERLGTPLRLSESSSRSQWRNRRGALERLGDLLEAAGETREERRPTAPSARARDRRLEEKRRRGARKRDRARHRTPED